MAKEFKLPELGENIDSADITKVIVSNGDKVNIDDPVLEIETDKATVEVPSEVAGTIVEVKVKDGDTAHTGDVIFTYEANDSESSENKNEQSSEAEDQKEESVSDETPKHEEKQVQANTGGTVEFKLPELGENIDSAEISKVLVSPGDEINIDDPVLEIETDKATVEVPSEIAGKIKEVSVKDGDTVKVGQVIFIAESSAADTGSVKSAPKQTGSDVKTSTAQEIKPEEPKQAKTSQSAAPQNVKQVINKRDLPKKIAPASPSVRRFAREIGIDIHNVPGSGPGGRISIDDVKAYAKQQNEKIQSGKAGLGIKQEPLPDFSRWGEVEIEPMSKIRKVTAEHLSYAWASIPHVTQMDKADITELEEFRNKYSKVVEKAGAKLTMTAMLVKIIAEGLKRFPALNCSIDMDKKEIIFKKYVHIGIAVDTPKGLLVPVLRDADKKSLIDISKELGEAAGKARDGKLSVDEMRGGTFSISNLGGIGGTYFTPVVNSPEVAILGVSRSSWEPVYRDGDFIARFMMPLSLSYDHRIVDGADAMRFLKWVVTSLENPMYIFMES